MSFDLFILENTPTDAQEQTEHNIDDIYNLLDSIDERLSDLQLENSSAGNTGTTSDVDIASLTDATMNISDDTKNIYVWVIVVAFIIVIFECKKMFRGAIKKWIDKN